MCVVMRRVRKLAYMRKLAPAPAGDLPEVPEWGGKLRIQAEMEVTKCVASAILFQKMREKERVRTSECVPGTSVASTPAQRQKIPNKSDAEVNLINQMWGDRTLASPPGTGVHSRSQSPHHRAQDVLATERIRKDLHNNLEREYGRDVASARQFIEQNHDELYTAARAAALGGAGSLAVLLQTLQKQVGLLASRRRCMRMSSSQFRARTQCSWCTLHVWVDFNSCMPCHAGEAWYLGGRRHGFSPT